MITRALRQFIQSEASGGIVLLGAALLALVVANSPLAPAYFDMLRIHAGGLSVLHWINDGLMALFFLLIGLELKRELLLGELSSWSLRLLPGAAAIAGMAVPAAMYAILNAGTPAYLRGWAIPAATDIAFALGILALMGSRVPVSLKVLLTAIAVIDDLLAIVVIALFYTSQIALTPLLLSGAGLAFLIGLNAFGVRSLWPYLLIGVGIWYGVHLSGVHATLAGVAVALTIPLRPSARSRGGKTKAPLARLEHNIQPWVAYLIVPIFGFANAGVSFASVTIADVASPLPIGIALALVLGKQIGIFGSIWLMVRFGLAEMPERASWRQIYGIAALCGIGFTMSLFIGGLAFRDADETMNAVKIGVLGGSTIAASWGLLILKGGREHG